MYMCVYIYVYTRSCRIYIINSIMVGEPMGSGRLRRGHVVRRAGGEQARQAWDSAFVGGSRGRGALGGVLLVEYSIV